MAQNEGRTLRRALQPSKIQVVLLFVAIVVSSVVFGLAVYNLKQLAHSMLAVNTAQAASPDINTGSDTVQATPAKIQSNQTQVARPASTPTVRNCTKATYALPTPINLSGLPSGLTVVEDSPQYYTIYGNNAEQQQKQLQQCSPVDKFAAAASYQVSWQYSYAVVDEGLCKIAEPKIGLHLNMVLPHWSAKDSQASDATGQNWQSFASNLSEHEKGHYKISRRYAQTMFQQLQQLPPESCATIEKKANGMLASKLRQLEIAQENYDSTTGHGTTQGATLL